MAESVCQRKKAENAAFLAEFSAWPNGCESALFFLLLFYFTDQKN